MAAFPTLPLQPGSSDAPSQKADAFVDGAGGHHVYWPAQKKRFSLKYILTTAQRDTLLAFYTTNRIASDISFLYLEDGLTYTVCFLERPKVEGIDKFPDHRNVSVELGQV